MITKVLDQFSKWFLHHQSFAGYIEPIMQMVKPAWRAGLYRAKIEELTQHNGDFLSITLKPTQHWQAHIAGQHISLTVEINGRLLTRVFTVASSPEQFKKTGLVRLLIKTNEQGRFTSLLSRALRVGEWCNVSAPSGDFVYKNTQNNATFIAGGSGITPMLAMISEHLKYTTQKVSLIYYAKAAAHQCVDELSALANQFSHFSFLLLTREQSDDITRHVNVWENPDIYCCGPANFMKTVCDFAKKHHLNYYQEAFGLTLPSQNDDSLFNVQINSSAHVVNANNALLAQFEAKQLPVKRGCGIGICHQCQCIKKSGVVRNLKTGELSDNGEQLIQLCVSQPVSDLELQL
ncbi:FAD-binding oxidoreductase [Pseudoalteromonas sp. Angola-30]|uniref:flavin reductase family protein n=1 Tax=unclassified Pseudoalteromonas TaxID=194690 RepID=UPI0020BE0E37|nr:MULTISPECIES: FAD-binding oxidoreductase [unclassified Pseudoalteromonas]MCK8116553.1 FAD-binding oxidoreductase [Pseudoalteromonas sp. 2CM37A]MDC9526411.1 FAD-binding oxidoreductase [Pseudoalteromonas sp. Angola-30]